jgi:hypothetical protein
MTLRVFTYLCGRKVCPVCVQPLKGLRRDARGHEACMREFRRHRRAKPSHGLTARQTPGKGHSCPKCGGRLLLVKLLAVGPLTDAEAILLAGEYRVSGGKRATCTFCEWRGTVAATRSKVAA